MQEIVCMGSINLSQLGTRMTHHYNCADIMSVHMFELCGQFMTRSENISEMGHGIYESQSPITELHNTVWK